MGFFEFGFDKGNNGLYAVNTKAGMERQSLNELSQEELNLLSISAVYKDFAKSAEIIEQLKEGGKDAVQMNGRTYCFVAMGTEYAEFAGFATGYFCLSPFTERAFVSDWGMIHKDKRLTLDVDKEWYGKQYKVMDVLNAGHKQYKSIRFSMKNMVGVIRYVTGYNAFSVSNLGSVPLIMYVKCNDGKKILSVEGNIIVSIQEVNAGKADYMAERYYKRSAGLLIDNMSGYDLISLCWLNRLEKIPLNLLFRTGRLENMNAFVVCVIRWSMNRVLHTEAKKGSMKKNGYCFSMSIQKGNFVCYENDTPEKGELNIYDITGSFAEAVIRENIETDVPFSYLSGRYLFRLYTECVLPVRYVVKDGDILFLISCKREEDKCRNRIYEFVLEGFHI